MIIEPAIAGEADDLAAARRAFCAERGGKCPAERARRAQIGLLRTVQLNHRAGPDAGIAGIDHENAIRRQRARHLGAQPLDRNRCGVLLDQGRHAVAPIRDNASRFVGEATVSCRPADHLDQTREGRFRVADDAVRVRIAAPDFERIGFDLHDRRVVSRDGPVKRYLVAGIAADEQHELGAMHDAVGGRRGIAAGDPGRQPMPGRDDAARAQGRSDRRGQRFGQREDLRPSAGHGGPIAGDDRDAARAGQQRRGALDVALIGDRPVHRNRPRLGFEDRRLGGAAELDDVALQPVEVEMGRARRVGERGAPGVA